MFHKLTFIKSKFHSYKLSYTILKCLLLKCHHFQCYIYMLDVTSLKYRYILLNPSINQAHPIMLSLSSIPFILSCIKKQSINHHLNICKSLMFHLLSLFFSSIISLCSPLFIQPTVYVEKKI
jgi:hypothetical protein